MAETNVTKKELRQLHRREFVAITEIVEACQSILVILQVNLQQDPINELLHEEERAVYS